MNVGLASLQDLVKVSVKNGKNAKLPNVTILKKPRNKFEISLHRQLKRAKVSFKYESEKIPYYFSGHYIPDFVIDGKDAKIYVEAKGYFRPEHKRKMVAVKKLHPTMDIRIVFYAFRKKDIVWAEKYGFPWAVQKIPGEWI